MNNLILSISSYIPFNHQEEIDKRKMLELLKEKDILTRNNLSHHLTASAWIVSKDFKKVLMVYHNIYNSWSWIGGHADGDSDLLKVAIKEAKEETGLINVKPYSEDILSLEILPVNSHFKNGKLIPSHNHLNVTYLLTADVDEELKMKPDENSGVKWIDINDIEKYVTEKIMYEKVYSKLCKKVEKEYAYI